MTLLEILECVFMMFNGRLQLLDVLRSSFTKGCLGLTVSLLSLLGCCVYLDESSLETLIGLQTRRHTGFLPPFLFCTWATSCMNCGSSGSGEDSEKDSRSDCSALGIAFVSSSLDISGSHSRQIYRSEVNSRVFVSRCLLCPRGVRL